MSTMLGSTWAAMASVEDVAPAPARGDPPEPFAGGGWLVVGGENGTSAFGAVGGGALGFAGTVVGALGFAGTVVGALMVGRGPCQRTTVPSAPPTPSPTTAVAAATRNAPFRVAGTGGAPGAVAGSRWSWPEPESRPGVVGGSQSGGGGAPSTPAPGLRSASVMTQSPVGGPRRGRAADRDHARSPPKHPHLSG